MTKVLRVGTLHGKSADRDGGAGFFGYASYAYLLSFFGQVTTHPYYNTLKQLCQAVCVIQRIYNQVEHMRWTLARYRLPGGLHGRLLTNATDCTHQQGYTSRARTMRGLVPRHGRGRAARTSRTTAPAGAVSACVRAVPYGTAGRGSYRSSLC